MTLVELLSKGFTKFIWQPHRHNWVFERSHNRHTEVMGLTSDGTEFLYKCSGCGKIIIAPRATWNQ